MTALGAAAPTCHRPRMHARALLLLTALACAPPRASSVPAPPAVDARAAWQRLATTLPGDWIAATDDGREIDIGFRAISNGSALAERFGAASGRETMTIYHPDGAGLVLTHYCGQGNQATLRATEVGEHRVVFAHVSATNVEPGQGVLAELRLEFDPAGARAVTRTEVYRLPDGSLERTRLRMRPAE